MAATDPIAARTPQALEMPQGLALGLPGYWYPIAHSDQIGDKPVGVERFGLNLAIWRDGTGRPSVFENHCPHRRAPLSLGNVQGRELVCSYHGWTFNQSGECIRKPLEAPDAATNQRHHVKTYAAEERAGYIWMFHGEREDATPLSIPPEFEDADWHSFNTEYVWDTNWLNVLDNVLDPLHAIYLHSGAVTQLNRAKFKEFQITADDESGFRLGKIGYRADGTVGSVEGEVEFILPNIVKLNIADGTKDGLYRVIIMPTPVNENRVSAFYARGRRGRGIERLKWWLWWGRHHRSVHAVAAQDRDIMEGIGPIESARRNEHLAKSDVGVARVRRRLYNAYRSIQDGGSENGSNKFGARDDR
jgi:phenylpropionate dioxygenase-like ring-hydroxylating dioxygenase large terminal subunit